jgi:hypothetical protein
VSGTRSSRALSRGQLDCWPFLGVASDYTGGPGASPASFRRRSRLTEKDAAEGRPRRGWERCGGR